MPLYNNKHGVCVFNSRQQLILQLCIVQMWLQLHTASKYWPVEWRQPLQHDSRGLHIAIGHRIRQQHSERTGLNDDSSKLQEHNSHKCASHQWFDFLLLQTQGRIALNVASACPLVLWTTTNSSTHQRRATYVCCKQWCAPPKIAIVETCKPLVCCL